MADFGERVRDVVARQRQGNLGTAIVNRYLAARHQPRRLLAQPVPNPYRPSSRRLNAIVQRTPPPVRYLEIGVDHGVTLETVDAPVRVGVEPDPQFDTDHLPRGVAMHQVTSDQFFASLPPETQFDLIFLDGLHTFEQTYRDLVHSLEHLSPCGVVLVDDVVPSDAFSAIRDSDESARARLKACSSMSAWHGDVFVVILIVHDHHPELEVRTIVGSGNEQAIIWPRDRTQQSVTIHNEILARYRSVTYNDVFAKGLPDCFHGEPEHQAITSALAVADR